MTNRLKEIKARVKAATVGPWFVSAEMRDEFDCPFVCVGPDNHLDFVTPEFPWSHEETLCEVWGAEHDAVANAAFIANAPADVGWLIDEVERLRSQVERYKRKWIRALPSDD